MTLQENEDGAADGDSIHLDHDMRSPSPPQGVSPAASGAPADGESSMTSTFLQGELFLLACFNAAAKLEACAAEENLISSNPLQGTGHRHMMT